MGGVGIRNLVVLASWAFTSSRAAVLCLANAIKGLEDFCMPGHIDQINQSNSSLRLELNNFHEQSLNSLLDSMDVSRNRVIKRSENWKASNWLTVLLRHHFYLSPRDALCLRYKRPLVMVRLTNWCKWFLFQLLFGLYMWIITRIKIVTRCDLERNYLIHYRQ